MGKGGKSHNDRVLAASVRTLALKEIKAILEDGKLEKYDKEFRNNIILKLAPTLLPRLNEHTGEDGERLTISFDPVFKQNATARETTEASGESSAI